MSGKFENVNKCAIPTSRASDMWRQKHLNNLKLAKIDHNVILTGDSLIANLERHPIWDMFQAFQTANFGIGGDKVEHVLYRLKNGELSNLKTKIVVILVGTNNTEHSKPHEIYEGIIKCVSIVKELLPSAHIILPTMLPRGRVPNAQRDCLEVVNSLLNKFNNINMNRRHIHIVHTHRNIVDERGFITREIMYDYLHLTAKGYDQCFQPVIDLIRKILTDK
ncbi:platelet-activating factor acetylhydrolase IB subunit beta-like [Ctenocephalides felis]|uniref:platelet-activating factor acetylhydrolase IB subunit beta-like n=1 Tax=Ctenocephalides felis TaxID=7515 RepID=UPI000E6E450B|nr:platelet-activating factor acetylhydrolase IB subunit beta-like [Ctenocephalides felis]